MLKATAGLMLPTTITGSLPRPSWYTENLGLKSFLDAMVIDRSDHLIEDAKPVLPRPHHRREVLVDGHHGLGLRPLVGIECAEGIFRGERDMIFAIGHQSPRSS